MKQMLMLKKVVKTIFFFVFYIGAAGGRDALKKLPVASF